MTTVYRTFDETYNSIVNPQQQAQPGTAYATPSTSGGFSSTDAPQPAAPALPTGGQSNRRTPPLTPNLRPIYEKLFSPIEQGQQAQGTALQGAVTGFSQAAGPRRSYEGIGGQNVLEKAIRGTEAEIPDYTTQAKALLGAKYTGPEMLDQTTTEQIGRALGNFQTQLGSTAGIRDLVRQGVPGLTRGQIGLETQVLSQDPWFRSRMMGERGDISKAFGRLGTAQREAKTYAEGRVAEEKDIAEKSKGYVTGERQKIVNDIQAKLTAADANQAKAQEAWNRYYDTGNLARLTQAGQATGQPDIAQGFATPANLQQGAAHNAMAQIMEKYGSIKDVPLMQLGVTSHGRQTLRFPDEWYSANASKYTPAQMAEMKEQSRLRQQDLEKVFGTQTDLQMFNPLYYGGAETVGELAEQGQLLPDSRFYTEFDPGIKPSRGNVSSADQRAQYNRMESLLDEADRIVAEDPMRAAKITTEIDQYLTDEEAALTGREKAVHGAEADWVNYVHKTRKRYRKMQDQKKWRKAIQYIPIANVIQQVGKTLGMNKNYLASQASSGTSGH